MAYLDYAANTPVDGRVLIKFLEESEHYVANPNSNHTLGKEARNKINECSKYISSFFNADAESVIYTSGASEANNLVIKGIAGMYEKGKIIISAVEHSSVVGPCNYLADKGYDVAVIPLKENGQIDLDVLAKEMTDDTILVSVCYVDSELGTIQPIKKIADIVSNYPNCKFHTDATQAIGKCEVDFECVDFVTFSPHKFYGLPGTGVLLNLNNTKLVPLIHGGKSTTPYRAGTPTTADIECCALAVDLALNRFEDRYERSVKISDYLKSELNKLGIELNTPVNAIPNTINFSVKNADDLYKYLDKHEIYVSTKAACALDDVPSKSVLAITGDKEKALNSIRVSISHLTNFSDIDEFIEALSKWLKDQ